MSYAFPPTGGAGVGRVVKLAKYLPSHGVTPRVLTAANPSVPVTDPSLARDLPPRLEVARARTLEPDYRVKRAAWRVRAGRGRAGAAVAGVALPLLGQLLAPDPQVLWLPGAARALAAELRAGVDVVWISGPPFSQFLLAPLARARPGTAVVLDYRDEWRTYRTAYEMTGAVPALVGAALERALLPCAHAVTAATDAFRDDLLERFSFLAPKRVHTVTNGFDPDDFPRPLPDPPRDRFTVTYAGTVFALTRPTALLEAVERLHRERPELARLLRVRFIGRVVDTEREALERMAPLGVECLGYLDKDRTLAELAASHMVVCLLSDVPGAERIYPGKIFELMHLGRPCLTVAPPGALRDLVDRHRFGSSFASDDAAGIAGALERALSAFRDGDHGAARGAVDIERYHRDTIAGVLAAVLRDAVRAASGGGNA